MAKTTTNRSLRPNTTVKAIRRAPVADDSETDGDTAAATSASAASRQPKRPGRAASLRTSVQRTRSQRWRSVADGSVKRSPNPVERAQGIRSRAKRA